MPAHIIENAIGARSSSPATITATSVMKAVLTIPPPS